MVIWGAAGWIGCPPTSSPPTTHIPVLRATPDSALGFISLVRPLFPLWVPAKSSCGPENVFRQKPRWMWLSCVFLSLQGTQPYAKSYLSLGFYFFSYFAVVYIVTSLVSSCLKLQVLPTRFLHCWNRSEVISAFYLSVLTGHESLRNQYNHYYLGANDTL